MLEIKRLDHFGLVAGVIKDLGLIELIDKHFEYDESEHISTGEAVAGMIINGLGFTQLPMSLTPKFFENKPLEILFREGVEASHFNRFKLGRSLDDIYEYGVEALFSEIALKVCKKEGIKIDLSHLDTTTFSLTGKYLPDTDENEIRITYGYSKDHRPDLKQAVLELASTQDGSVPFICKCHDGNASDNTIFRERVSSIIEQIKAGECPTCVVMDSKGYGSENAENLKQIAFITRVPNTFSLVGETIEKALSNGGWHIINEDYKCQSFESFCLEFNHRWVVVWSKGAYERGISSISKKVAKEKDSIAKALKSLNKTSFSSEESALSELNMIKKKWKFHKVEAVEYEFKTKYAKAGRPKSDTAVKQVDVHIKASFTEAKEAVVQQQQREACFIIAANVDSATYSDEDILSNYKKQSCVEGGFRFLKDPLFFASSLFLKKPSRIAGLLMVMTLSLMVYNVAQRRLRNAMEAQNETIPNQIGKQVTKPTLRWVFQTFEGINFVKTITGESVQCIIHGINDLHKKVIRLLGGAACGIYQLSTN
jgi:transposase